VGCAGNAMAKDAGILVSDVLCARCDGTIQSWNDPQKVRSTWAMAIANHLSLWQNRTLTDHIGWCSWCMEHGPHRRTQTSTLTRHIYECNGMTFHSIHVVSPERSMSAAYSSVSQLQHVWTAHICLLSRSQRHGSRRTWLGQQHVFCLRGRRSGD
jgi:hypothetical protein